MLKVKMNELKKMISEADGVKLTTDGKSGKVTLVKNGKIRIIQFVLLEE